MALARSPPYGGGAHKFAKVAQVVRISGAGWDAFSFPRSEIPDLGHSGSCGSMRCPAAFARSRPSKPRWGIHELRFSGAKAPSLPGLIQGPEGPFSLPESDLLLIRVGRCKERVCRRGRCRCGCAWRLPQSRERSHRSCPWRASRDSIWDARRPSGRAIGAGCGSRRG